MKRLKQKRKSPTRENSGSDNDDDNKPDSGGSSAAARAPARTQGSGSNKRTADGTEVAFKAIRPPKQLLRSGHFSGDGNGDAQWSSGRIVDLDDLPSTESESETDCDGILPSLLQAAEVDSDEAGHDMEVDDPSTSSSLAVLLPLRSTPPGPPSFALPPIFTGLRFREVHQSVAGCRDLMRVLVTCDADIIPAATTTSSKNASDIHRVVDVKQNNASSTSGESTEVIVESEWVWQCVRAGRLLAV